MSSSIDSPTASNGSSSIPTANGDGSKIGHVVLGVLGGLSLASLIVVIAVPLMRWRWRRRLASEGNSDVESSRAGSRRTHARIISAQEASLPLLIEQTQAGAAPEMVTVEMVDGFTAPVAQQQRLSSTFQGSGWKILAKLPSFSSDSLSSLGQPLERSEKKWNAEEELDAFFRAKEMEKDVGTMESASVTIVSASQTSLPAHLRAPPILTQDASLRRSRVDSEKGTGSTRATPTISETLHSSDYTPTSARPSRTSTLLGASNSPLLPTPVLSLSPLDKSFIELEPYSDNDSTPGASGSNPKATPEKAQTLPTARNNRASMVTPVVNLARSASIPRPREMKWMSNVLSSNFFSAKSSRSVREQTTRKPPTRMPSIPESLRPSQISHSPTGNASSSRGQLHESGIPNMSEFGEFPKSANSQQTFGRNSSEFSRRPVSDATIGTFGRQPSSASGASFHRAASGASSSYPPELLAHYRNHSDTTDLTNSTGKRSQSDSDSKSGSGRGRRSNEASESSQSQRSTSGRSVGRSKSRRVSYAREPSPPLPTMPLSIPPSLKPPLPPKPNSSTGHDTQEDDDTVPFISSTGADLSVPHLPLRPISPFTFDDFSFRVTPPASTREHSKSRSGSARSNASRKPSGSAGRATPPVLSSTPLPDDARPLLSGLETPPLETGEHGQ